MKLEPEYCENVIGGVMHKKRFGWYVTPKDIWRLDYKREYEMWQEWYTKEGRSRKRFLHEVGSFEEFCGRRWGIEVVNTDTAERFLDRLKKYSCTADELRELYDSGENTEALAPAFYTDFDRRKFYSYFPEEEDFHSFVPKGWNGEYCDFRSLIDSKYVYWAGE